jgi:hypothetical protein
VRRLYPLAAAILALIPIGGPVEAREPQWATGLMSQTENGEKPGGESKNRGSVDAA